MFTKQYYKTLANILAHQTCFEHHGIKAIAYGSLLRALANAFAQDNNRFDAAKFFQACYNQEVMRKASTGKGV